jgi:hypothetical protein
MDNTTLSLVAVKRDNDWRIALIRNSLVDGIEEIEFTGDVARCTP